MARRPAVALTAAVAATLGAALLVPAPALAGADVRHGPPGHAPAYGHGNGHGHGGDHGGPPWADQAKMPVAVGAGGAVASVDRDATQIGIDVLARGGNAVDAAVATAAALGVTEPYSAGVGGGGYFVYYDAKTRRVHTIDGRETAPLRMKSDSFTENGQAIPFGEAVTSGLSVGVPGTGATWELALRQWGKFSLAKALAEPTRLARNGFVVDQTFHDQTADNATRFGYFTSTSALFLPGGAPPAVGSTFRNPLLAQTYDLLARRGMSELYRGQLATEIAATAQNPPVAPGVTAPIRHGLMTTTDLAIYRALLQDPTHVGYRGLDVYGMAPSSSGGSTVGEALNIMERFPLSRLSLTEAQHIYLESSALAFADRNRYVGDRRYVDVPLRELLSDGFAAERACLIDPAHALPKPVAPGSPDGRYDTSCTPGTPAGGDQEGLSTTHLTTADKWGNVVAYTLTIEQTGGSGIAVPGRGFLLNNELTDFNFTDTQGGVDPNLPAPGKRPRSSMSPTIVLRHGQPALAVGSPGGSTIITTVLQILFNRLDLGMTLPEAIAAPRASQRNTSTVSAEPDFPRAALEALGHRFSNSAEIGAATGIEFLGRGQLQAAAEPVRRGGGSAMVVRPRR
jgi:gamma-glutamyltranspeptidase/glutathione hydrolase